MCKGRDLGAKPIYARKFLLQKINYIHLNPVKGKWKLISDWREYEHSSASVYELNKVVHYEPLHYDELYQEVAINWRYAGFHS